MRPASSEFLFLACPYRCAEYILDLCIWKGRFPSRKAQFCTSELKTMPLVEYLVWAALPLHMTTLTPPDKKWFKLKATKR